MATDISTSAEVDVTRDPIGLEPFLTVLGIAITTLGVAHQFGLLSPRHRRIRRNFGRLREDVLRLHTCVDDLILTVQRHSQFKNLQFGEGPHLTEQRATLSATLLDLRELDYVRWRDVQDRIQAVGQSIYKVAHDTRQVAQDLGDESVAETLGNDVLSPVDELIVRFGTMTFGEFVVGIRNVLTKLEETLTYVLKREG